GQLDSEPAAMTAGAAGVRAQCEALDQEGILDFLKLDRRIAHIALADRHRGRLAILAWPPAPAAAENVHQQETPAITSEAPKQAASHIALVGGRDAVRQRRRQRLEDGIDHRWQRDAPQPERRR